MTDAEISYKLAMAIGWKADECRVYHTGRGDEQRAEVFYQPLMAPAGCRIWRAFSYTDPTVIWPIAARHKCFPWHDEYAHPSRQWTVYHGKKAYDAETPELAVAMAVIGSA